MWTLINLERKLSNVQIGMEGSVVGITIMVKKNCTWIKSDEYDAIDKVIKIT